MNSVKNNNPKDSKIYLTGTGIGSITAAVNLIQKCGWDGSNIHIFEQGEEKYAGGCCDAQYDKEKDQYSMRGSRMFEEQVYRCTKELWSLIPSMENPGKTALDDHNKHWNECRVDTKVRLIFDGVRKDDGLHLGLSKADMFNMAKLMMMQEWMLGEKKISDMFTPEMFKTNYWYMWRTTFAFHQWHSAVELKRYMHLFYHTMPHFHDMTPIQRTKYTNFHSFMLPALKLLADKGVHIHYQSKIADAEFTKANGKFVTESWEEIGGWSGTLSAMLAQSGVRRGGTRCKRPPHLEWRERRLQDRRKALRAMRMW